MTSAAQNLNGNGIRPVPGLDDVAHDSNCLSNLPLRTLAALSSRAAAVQAAIAAAQLSACLPAIEVAARSTASRSDRTLNADEIAAELGQTRRWVFRHATKLDFVRRISRKSLAASESDLRRWRDIQKA
jgi:predicted DNA-binding transcriptional regulator AlpA